MSAEHCYSIAVQSCGLHIEQLVSSQEGTEDTAWSAIAAGVGEEALQLLVVSLHPELLNKDNVMI